MSKATMALGRTRPRVLVAGAAALIAAGAAAGAVIPRLDERSATSASDRAATVEGIYPSGARLPANLLRMYVVFSQPMSVGESRSRLRLVDGAGATVERAFLHLEEELWDPGGRRLTILFDPGRIKRGLRANLEEGPPLREGRRYQLVVDGRWLDARGRPLGADTVKTFDVDAADRVRPDVEAWTVVAPRAGTRGSVVLRFNEALDRALLSSAVTVADASGAVVTGVIDVAEGERSWTLTPEAPWRPGSYGVRVAPELEDVAGNNLTRLFDVDVTHDRRVDAVTPAERRLRFLVAATHEPS